MWLDSLILFVEIYKFLQKSASELNPAHPQTKWAALGKKQEDI